MFLTFSRTLGNRNGLFQKKKNVSFTCHRYFGENWYSGIERRPVHAPVRMVIYYLLSLEIGTRIRPLKYEEQCWTVFLVSYE